MKALMVTVNGVRACLAGCSDEATLMSGVFFHPKSQTEQIVLESFLFEADRMATWPNLPPLKIGDEVCISIIESDSVDEPILTHFPPLTLAQRMRFCAGILFGNRGKPISNSPTIRGNALSC